MPNSSGTGGQAKGSTLAPNRNIKLRHGHLTVPAKNAGTMYPIQVWLHGPTQSPLCCCLRGCCCCLQGPDQAPMHRRSSTASAHHPHPRHWRQMLPCHLQLHHCLPLFHCHSHQLLRLPRCLPCAHACARWQLAFAVALASWSCTMQQGGTHTFLRTAWYQGPTQSRHHKPARTWSSMQPSDAKNGVHSVLRHAI
jgi:hypothetical protein